MGAQFKISTTWKGKQGPDGVILDLAVRQSCGTDDNKRWLKRQPETSQSLSIGNEEHVNSIIAGYRLVHKQSIDGWMHFVPPENLGAL